MTERHKPNCHLRLVGHTGAEEGCFGCTCGKAWSEREEAWGKWRREAAIAKDSPYQSAFFAGWDARAALAEGQETQACARGDHAGCLDSNRRVHGKGSDKPCPCDCHAERNPPARPTRWHEGMREWQAEKELPRRLNEVTWLARPLCWAYVDDDEVCIRELGHDSGAHEPTRAAVSEGKE